MKLCALLSAAAATSSPWAADASVIMHRSTRSSGHGADVAAAVTRVLEDQNGNYYNYLDDVSGYSIQYSKCLRVKIPNNNDDDEVEGNTYYYNGRYHAQAKRYASFHLCSDDGTGTCDCDYSLEYATEIGQFLETTTEFLEEYCGSCLNTCGGRRDRKLEDSEDEGDDEEDEEYMDVDCNKCQNECTLYNQGDDGSGDETQYVDCTEAYEDEDGIQYYYAPQCGDDGEIVVGVFYDDECTVKTKIDSPEFGYSKFQTVASTCIDCSLGDACMDLYENSYHCVNGVEVSGQSEDEDMPVCSTVKKASFTHDYTKRKTGASKFVITLGTIVAVSVFGGFFFLSYSYYVRHRADTSLAAQDHYVQDDADSPVAASHATLT